MILTVSVCSPMMRGNLTQLIMMLSINSHFYASTELSELPGIGRRTPRALARYGMKTIGQFSRLTESEAGALLGRSGVRLLRLAQQLLKDSVYA